MNPSPFLGVFLHSIGGFAAGSFYIPFRKVRKWAWESYWLMQGVLAWIIMPWLIAWLTTPRLLSVLSHSPSGSIEWAFLFGALWGIGGLTFGLSMRYLGMSLGYAMSLGFTAVFGTLVPPIFHGKFIPMAHTASGQAVLAGVVVCVIGIAVCALAGIHKERELTTEEKQSTIEEFDLVKGFLVAAFAGVMSACMAFGIDAGKPIAHTALLAGTDSVYQNNSVFVPIMAGGFLTNLIWCGILNIKNKTAGDYLTGKGGQLAANYFFAGLAGIIWFGQFFFYGMGTTKMGRYNFSSWSIHMAFIIVFSNLWGLFFHEWKGVRPVTRKLIWSGIAVLIFSTIVIGFGNYLAA
ncbi:MAG: L-rhamnose/proton symporter RhaT [Armatimonadetes bacterium]|nr:L-rhamnose/proton symporter RhaT [Armatimonadota bacterium]